MEKTLNHYRIDALDADGQPQSLFAEGPSIEWAEKFFGEWAKINGYTLTSNTSVFKEYTWHGTEEEWNELNRPKDSQQREEGEPPQDVPSTRSLRSDDEVS